MLRHVIRPEGISGTPKALAQELGVQTRKWPGFSGTPDFDTDLFLVYPDAINVKAADIQAYGVCRTFFAMDKAHQRQALGAQGIPIPGTFTHKSHVTASPSGKFVVRPMRHSGGENYRVTENMLDFNEGSEYISHLFMKKREYRIIFAFGQPLIYMRKKQNDGVGAELPWGHQNSVFQTISDVPGSLIAQTDCVAKLTALSVIKTAHLVAADILYANGKYVVLELNTCPGLDIDANRAKVVEAVKAHFIGDTAVDDIQSSMATPAAVNPAPSVNVHVPAPTISAPPVPQAPPTPAAPSLWTTNVQVVKTYQLSVAGNMLTLTGSQLDKLISDLKALKAA